MRIVKVNVIAHFFEQPVLEPAVFIGKQQLEFSSRDVGETRVALQAHDDPRQGRSSDLERIPAACGAGF